MTCFEGDVTQWLERLTASPVMHASRFRKPLIPCGVFRETSMFIPYQCDWAINKWRPRRIKVDQCIDVNFAQGKALRAPHTHFESSLTQVFPTVFGDNR